MGLGKACRCSRSAPGPLPQWTVLSKGATWARELGGLLCAGRGYFLLSAHAAREEPCSRTWAGHVTGNRTQGPPTPTAPQGGYFWAPRGFRWSDCSPSWPLTKYLHSHVISVQPRHAWLLGGSLVIPLSSWGPESTLRAESDWLLSFLSNWHLVAIWPQRDSAGVFLCNCLSCMGQLESPGGRFGIHVIIKKPLSTMCVLREWLQAPP